MGRLSSRGGEMVSPLQKHRVYVANEVLWITGEMETMGNPHNYINQDGLNYIRISEPHIAPWSFTGLPSSHIPLIIAPREHIQFMIFPEEATMEQFRAPLRTVPLILNLSLAVIRGQAPFLSEAQAHNFLDYWKGIFFPMTETSIYYMADSPAEQPTEMPLIYVNRNVIQSYTEE